jgi:The GLUG motif
MKTMKWKLSLPIVALAMLYIYGCGETNPGSTTTENPAEPTSPQLQASTVCNATAAPFAAGDGSIGNPYVISSFCNLYAFSMNPTYWTTYVILGNNIDMTGMNFSPVIEFSGTFNGNQRVISNWVSSYPLFSVNRGTIQNLNLRNVTLTPLGSARPGTLVGTNMPGATINNCTATGTVNGVAAANLDSDNDIYWFVGGLVGINAGAIVHSSAAVNVSGMQSVGGLVGQNEGGTIQTSFSTGTVTSTTSGSNFGVGGLVGTHTTGTISNSYSTGVVQGQSQAGGLVGYSASVIQNCYSAGAVNGTGTNIGGLVGQNSGGTIAASFWDQTASGQTVSGGGTGETTAAMQTASTFAGWDFTATWVTPVGSYPGLR